MAPAPLGSEARPVRVAVIGSGPSAFYATEALFKAPLHVRVDMFDRLPTPYGLVRGGVAPDHQNIKAVGVEDVCELMMASAFVWAQRDLPKGEGGPKAEVGNPETPWLAFISPPYSFFIERQDEMLMLIEALLNHAPPESMVVVEADQRFDFSLLPGRVKEHRSESGWDVREYAPAVVGVLRIGDSAE